MTSFIQRPSEVLAMIIAQKVIELIKDYPKLEAKQQYLRGAQFYREIKEIIHDTMIMSDDLIEQLWKIAMDKKNTEMPPKFFSTESDTQSRS